MKPGAALALAFGVFLAAAPGAAQLTPIVSATGEPEVDTAGIAATLSPVTEAEYRRLAADIKSPSFVQIRTKPAGLTAKARFGMHFQLGGRHVSWVLDGDEAAGYTIWIDLNANGDLSDDAPLSFVSENGKPAREIRTTHRARPEDGGEPYSMVSKIVIETAAARGSGAPRLILKRYEETTRRGTITVGSRPVAFQLHGHGVYNFDFLDVEFDLNGDAAFSAAESFMIAEKHVNIGDKTYAFTVDRYGRSLTLTPLAEKRPARLVLIPGAPVPDFSFTDVGGSPKKLSDYRGKVVLLDFWGIWCGPCVAAIPELAAAYAKYHARGFEIIAVDANDTKDKLLPFIRDKRMSWTHTMEDDKGPLHMLFRVTGWPSYFLIGKDGHIVVAARGGTKFDLDAELAKLMKKPGVN